MKFSFWFLILFAFVVISDLYSYSNDYSFLTSSKYSDGHSFVPILNYHSSESILSCHSYESTLDCHSCESRNPEEDVEMDSRLHGNDIVGSHSCESTSDCHSCESRNPEENVEMDSRLHGNDIVGSHSYESTSDCHSCESRNPEENMEMDSRLHGNDIDGSHSCESTLDCHSCESRNPEEDVEMDSRLHGNDIIDSHSYESTLDCHSCESRNPEEDVEMDSRLHGNDIIDSHSYESTSDCHSCESRNPEEDVEMDSRLHGNDIVGSHYYESTFYSQIPLYDSSLSNQNEYIFKFTQLEPVQPINFSPFQNKINYYALGFTIAATATSVGVLHYHQSKAWWQASRTKFHFQNDWEYALWIDKLGHWWGATAIQHLFSSSLSWSNFSDETSMILGSTLAFAYQLYVETYDGYASNWGFSPGDAMFDFGGAFYPLLQYYYPPLKNVNLKLSYYPSKRLLKKDPLDSLYKNKFVIDDYEGQSFYLSFKINNMLPESLEKYWPDFLCLAIGYQMRNWNGYGSADKNFYLALDYDVEQIPLYGKFWQFLKNTFNLIHLPSPALKISNKKITFSIAY